MAEALVILIVAGAALAVAYPALRRPAATGAESNDEAEELVQRKDRVLASLREIESDREAGNLSEADYEALKREYEAEAAVILRKLDELGRAASRGRERAPRRAEAAETASPRGAPALLWAFAVIVFVVLAGAMLSRAIGPRGPEGSITGNDAVRGGGGAGGPEGAGGAGGGGALVPVDLSRVPELEARLRADSTDLQALLALGHIDIATQRFEEAAALSMRALRQSPGNAEALTHLGVVLWASSDTDNGLEAFNQALASDENLAEALLFKGILLFTAKQDFQGAVAAWERYLEVAPPEANTARVRAMLEGARQAARSAAGAR